MTANTADDSDEDSARVAISAPRRRDLPRSVWLLVAARTVNGLGAFTLTFLGVILVQELGASLGQAGLVVALFGVATIASRLLGGVLADRVGRVPTMVAGLVGSGAALLGVAASSSLTAAAIGVIALGLCFELYEPPSQALVADLTQDAARASAYGLLSAALAVAGALAGLLAVALGALGLRWLLIADAGTCLLAGALIAVGIRDVATHHHGDSRGQASPWRDRRLLGLLVAGTGFAVVYLAGVTALPLTLVVRGLPVQQTGLLLTVSALTILAGQPLLRWRALGDDGFRALTVGYAVLAAGLALAGLASSLGTFVLAVIVWSLGDLLLLGHALTIVARLAPASARGRYLAAYGLSWGIAATVAPVVATQLLQRTGPGTTWAVLALGATVLSLGQPSLARLCRASLLGPRCAD